MQSAAARVSTNAAASSPPLRLRVVSLPFDPERNAFDDAQLRALPEDLDIVELHEQVVEPLDGGLVWAILLMYRSGSTPPELPETVPESAPEPKPAPRKRTNWRAELDPDEQPLYDALHRWRSEQAIEHNVPPYVVLTNRAMAEIARRLPANEDELLGVPGIGPAKIERYGAGVLAMVRRGTGSETDDEE